MIDQEHWFSKARFGLFVHYGLFSMHERGEWVMNRERMSKERMRGYAEQFEPSAFDANRFCELAVDAGARYICLTTMHHEGFRLYDTELTDFNAMAYCGRDLVKEFVTAARKHGLRVSLYHSLNNWFDSPDGVDALENMKLYERYIANTHARIKELLTRFPNIDCLWYDGWWPFDANGWKAEEMNAMVREINPGIIFNGRNGLPGDFGTPEGHMNAPSPWRPWEACMTGNLNWGFHAGDNMWKTPKEIILMLAAAAKGCGNLLFNVGPRKDGSIPPASYFQMRETGAWLKRHREAIDVEDRFSFDLQTREGHAGDWSHNGPFTRNGKVLYQIVPHWCGRELVIGGLMQQAKQVELLTTGQVCDFYQDGGVLTVTGLPTACPDPYAAVLKIMFDEAPEMYLAGGMRIPNCPHPWYDPCESDIQH